MSFAEPWLLWGLLLGVVPLALHLLARRQPVKLPWAAMQFLTAAIQKNRRRMRLEELWRLLLRLAIVMLPAIALARPIWSSSASIVPTDLATRHVLVIDATLSLGTKPADRSSPSAVSTGNAWERALRRAREVVTSAPAGTAFQIVVLAGDDPHPVVSEPSWAKSELLGELGRLRLTDTAAKPLTTLRLIRRWLEPPVTGASVRFERQIVTIFTDLQAATWNFGEGSPDREGLAAIRQRAEIRWEDVGDDLDFNHAITGLELSSAVLLRKEPFRVTATIEGWGTIPIAKPLVFALLKVDGQLSQSLPVDFDERGRAKVVFELQFEGSGQRALEVGLSKIPTGSSAGTDNDGQNVDRRPADDRRYVVANIREELRVLLVDGKPTPARFENATDYLRLALDPGNEGQQFRIETIPVDELLSTRLTKFDVVCVCDPPALSANEVAVIEEYLRQGGGVIVGFGPQARLTDFRQVLGRASAAWWPVEMEEVQGNADDPREIVEFDPLGYRHPIVAPFAGNPGAGLAATKTFAYVRLTKRPDVESDVALQFTSGDPAIVTSRVGAGRLVIVSTPFDRSWGTWALWGHSLVPLAHEMMRYAAAETDAVRSVVAGDEVFAHRSTTSEPLAEGSPRAGSELPWMWVTPSGEESMVLPVADRAIARPEQAGLYRLMRRTAAANDSANRNASTSRRADSGREATQWFAVNPDTRESPIERVSLAEAISASSGGTGTNSEEASSAGGLPSTGEVDASVGPNESRRLNQDSPASDGWSQLLLLVVLFLLLADAIFGRTVLPRWFRR